MFTAFVASGRRPNRCDRKRRGAALIETAIALPFLLAVVLGTVDFGRYAYTAIAVTSAAREGAAYGSSHSFTEDTESQWQTNLRQAVVSELQTVANFDEQKMVLPTGATGRQLARARGVG